MPFKRGGVSERIWNTFAAVLDGASVGVPDFTETIEPVMIYFAWSRSMQVSKWGNSLAIRLPQSVVEALQLKEGDEIEISVASARDFVVDRDRRRERALEILRNSNWKFPPGWKFERDAANQREDRPAIEGSHVIEDRDSTRKSTRGRRRAG